ncbi:MAG TPA: M1 family aminopeptidase, partial [Kofleriaceae bacterium]|nr:M1 family aminopeptidase [Kofleriaceae bacterium]
PRFWGTMEHPGIVAMGQPLTLIRPEQETYTNKLHYTNILAHELSHYWFGDLVTMAWWEDTWLNEALGSWSDVNITEAAEPTWRIRDDRAIAYGAMEADETLSTRMVRNPVTTKEGIEASFDNRITYEKGSTVFRMFESFVGRDRWRKFIHSYLAAHAWGNASADDFFASAAQNLGAEVAAGLRTFLEQPGVPRISAAVRCEPHKPPSVELTQQRSLPAGVTDPQPRLWNLPVCLRYGDARSSYQQCIPMSTATAVVELAGAPVGAARGAQPRGCPTWMITNAAAVGYYRSTVDPAITRALLTPSSPIARVARPTPAERMLLVEDSRAAVVRDELAIDKLLALVVVVAADPDPKVAQHALWAASIPLGGLDDAMYRAGERFYHQAFAARAKRLGWRRGPKDSEDVHTLRRELVPLVAKDDAALTAEATRLADQWLEHRTGIADDLVAAVLEVSAYHGDAARFDRYLAAAKSAPDRNEKQRLLSALGDFHDPAIVDQALAIVLGTEFDLRDTRGILFGVLGHRETRDLGIAFVSAHIDELLARLRDDEAAGLLGSLASPFCDRDRVAKMAALVTPRARRFGGAENEVTRDLEQANQCIAYVERQLPALRRVLGAK